MPTTPAKNYSAVSLTPAKHACAGVNDTGEAPEKLNISEYSKKLKSLLGLSTGARRSCVKKKTRGEKPGGTVPLRECLTNGEWTARGGRTEQN
jgi:hypothetical protein